MRIRLKIHKTRAAHILGMSLVESLIAISVLGVALTGILSGISYMRVENRASSERILVGSIATQILELFKALPYSAITNSTAGTPIYLEGYGTSSPNTAWYVPQAGQSQTLPVEDVNSTSAATPALVPNKIPQGTWSANIVTTGSTHGYKQVTVTVTWEVYAGSTRPPCTYSLSTLISGDEPNL